MVDDTVTDDLAARDLRHDASTLTAKLAQLESLLEMTYGEARETFESMGPDLRDNYLWACADATRVCATLATNLETVILSGGRYTAPTGVEVAHG